MCMSVVPACTAVCRVHAVSKEVKEEVRSPGTGIPDDCEARVGAGNRATKALNYWTISPASRQVLMKLGSVHHEGLTVATLSEWTEKQRCGLSNPCILQGFGLGSKKEMAEVTIWLALPVFLCDSFSKFIITRNKFQILYHSKELKKQLLNESPFHLTSKVGYSNDLTWEQCSVFFFSVHSRKKLIYKVIILYNLSHQVCD